LHKYGYQQISAAFLGTMSPESAKASNEIGAAESMSAAGASFTRGTNHMMSKSELIQKISDEVSVSKKDVKAVIESLASIGYKEMKKSGMFLLPGFAKFIVVKKPATKERTGINPFTKEPTVFKAKPARKILKVRPVKAAKDAV
jgi:DNA-binding protein HU-beta